MIEAKYFSVEEFACKCGCGYNPISPQFIIGLDKARGLADTPFNITSGCRCKTHNKNVGGVDTSSHIKGLAVDIAARNSVERFKIVNALLSVGFSRIGIGKDFVHVDIDKAKTQNVLWTYYG